MPQDHETRHDLASLRIAARRREESLKRIEQVLRGVYWPALLIYGLTGVLGAAAGVALGLWLGGIR